MSEPAFTELDHVTELYAISEKENRDLKRKVHRLELANQSVSEDSPEATQIQELLDLWWVEVMNSHPNVAHSLKSTRAAKVRTALKRRKGIAVDQGFEQEWGYKMCRKAILGVLHDDWAMGRVAKSRGKKFNDIAEHILNTDGDIEKFAGLFDRWCSQITEKPLEPAVADRIEQQRVKRDRDVQRNIQRWEQAAREDPAEAVLAALTRGGWDWRCTPRGGWEAQCPAHQGDDRNLSIDWNGAEDKLLLTCWSHHCETSYVVGALGLPLSALFRREAAA